MSYVYEVIDNYEGKDMVFKYEDDAENHVKVVKNYLHNKYCVEKDTPDKCLCTRSNGKQMCASHHYALNVDNHNLEDCDLANDNVFIEEKEIN